MISTEHVLTATPVVLEKIPATMRLSKNANSIVHGLDLSTAKWLDKYTLSNIATELVKNTAGEDSEHSELVNLTTAKISTAIRTSLTAIRERIIPSCDVIEQNIIKMGNLSNIYDLIFNKLYVKFHFVSQALFDSHLFPQAVPEQYRDGVGFTTANITELGQWPQKPYEEIKALLQSAAHYPEFYDVINDRDSVLAAWNSLGRPVDWLKTFNDVITPAGVLAKFTDLNKLVALTLLVNRLVADDDPVAGVTGIALSDYRKKLLNTKRFLEAVLFHFKRRYQVGLANGLRVDQSDVKFEKCVDDRSPFFNALVASGCVEVVYTESLSDFIANSDEYSLSTIVLGIVIATQRKRTPPCDTLLDNLKFYTETATQYASELRYTVGENGKIATAKAVKDSIHQLAHSELWKTQLQPYGQNLAWELEKRLTEAGGIVETLMRPDTYQRIQAGELRVANTPVVVTFAKAAGYPIAATILAKNINNTSGLNEQQQRKLLAKSLAYYVVSTLLGQQPSA